MASSGVPHVLAVVLRGTHVGVQLVLRGLDVTGDELDACTVWQGVIYTADAAGAIGLLPKRGDAPETLVFPDLGPSLQLSAAYGANGFSKVPWDVFALKGCQE